MPELEERSRAGSRPVADRLGRVQANRDVRRAVKYGIVGVANVTLDFALYAVLVSLGVWYPLAKTGAVIVATANGYTFNRLWTFRAGAHRTAFLVKYVTVQVSCLALNLCLLVLLIEGAGLDKILAQAVALPFVAGASFTAQRLWTFRAALR
jgi:putative flippase GtrA